ncbi:MAG: hypothetical protein LBR10_03780 [Prevotellaceae bacterium]|jgi:hypothetical protein|nr:hypothetical protein [Prevotellaceae bacterium]
MKEMKKMKETKELFVETNPDRECQTLSGDSGGEIIRVIRVIRGLNHQTVKI